jgi:hypothetical protein
LGIDITKVMVEGSKDLIGSHSPSSCRSIVGLYSKTIVGYDAGMPGKAQHWLSALDMAVNGQAPEGRRGPGLSLMGDNWCQPTSTAFMQD